MREHAIVIYPRRGYQTDQATLPSSVRVVNTELIDISSTDIRMRVKQGKSIKGMVAPAIEPLVHRLYDQ